ncbi:NAD(+) salvage pathway protein [Aspergillus wentii]|nr:NAD(+) salvage pathway protein [Aspergillus wentii]
MSALIVVDMQEDFCPPDGSLAVEGGRSIAPVINSLLGLPGFVVRIATQDYHPLDHISFASNYPEPNNKPYESFIEMTNPAPGKQSETKRQLLWPVHCVAGCKGASIISEIDTDKIDVYVKKGMDARVEMYSVFGDPFGNLDPAVTFQSVDVDIKSVLEESKITDVFIVGLAGDYCVKATAIDAAKAGYRTFVVEEGTRCVIPGKGWEETKRELSEAGVSVVGADGPEVLRLAGY